MTNTKTPDIIRTLQQTIADLEAEVRAVRTETEAREKKIAVLKTTLVGLGATSTTSQLAAKAQKHARVTSRSEAWDEQMRADASERMKSIWKARRKSKYSRLAANAVH